MANNAEYPEHAKLSLYFEGQMSAIYEFIEFLEGNGYELTKWVRKKDEQPVEQPVKFQDALYDMLGVDKAKLELERQQMLKKYPINKLDSK